MLCDPTLASNENIIPDSYTPCDARLCSDETAFSNDDIVCNVHLIIELGVCSDCCVSPTPPVNCAASSQLHVVANHNSQSLRFLCHTAVIGIESETILSDANTWVQNNIPAKSGICHHTIRSNC
mmetsp:Transcript_61330/g.133259  ORF Transcript_61330/g.133259 Transcript_61330/m.133259 type:complete len:124 (+) Transcript_61330:541-912(+)